MQLNDGHHMINPNILQPFQEMTGRGHTESLIIQDFLIIPERHLFDDNKYKRTINEFILNI